VGAGWLMLPCHMVVLFCHPDSILLLMKYSPYFVVLLFV
jgi:hypothetical protein